MRTSRFTARFAIVASSSAVVIALGACSSASTPDPIGSTSEDLYGLGSLATAWTNGVVPVCFQNLSDHPQLQTPIPGILARTWSAAANITFTGFGSCPSSGNYVTIEFSTATAFRGSTSSLGQGTPVVTLISDDASPGQTRFVYEVIHELGHALGFAHEMKRPDNWVDGTAINCPPSDVGDSQYVDTPGGIYLTPTYDSASIMNYCDPNGYNTTLLSLGDVLGAKQAYGDSGLPVVTSVSPTSGPYSGGTSVTVTGLNFNTAGRTTVYFGGLAASGASCPTSSTCYASAPRSVPSTVDVQVQVAGVGSSLTPCAQVTPGSPTGCSLPVVQDQYTYTSACFPMTEAEACEVSIGGVAYTQSCGVVPDGCGGTESCGTCSASEYCSPSYGFNACEPLPLCPFPCASGYICEAPNGYPGTCVINHRCKAPEKYCNGTCIPQNANCP